MAIPSMLLHYFNSFKLFSAYIASLHFLFVIPAARKVICQLNKIDAKAPHHTQMHVISLIDNATFFKPITLEYILSEDQELVRPKLLARSALAALCKTTMSALLPMPAGVAGSQMSLKAASLTRMVCQLSCYGGQHKYLAYASAVKDASCSCGKNVLYCL